MPALLTNVKIFRKKFAKDLVGSKKSYTFAPANEKEGHARPVRQTRLKYCLGN